MVFDRDSQKRVMSAVVPRDRGVFLSEWKSGEEPSADWGESALVVGHGVLSL